MWHCSKFNEWELRPSVWASRNEHDWLACALPLASPIPEPLSFLSVTFFSLIFDSLSPFGCSPDAHHSDLPRRVLGVFSILRLSPSLPSTRITPFPILRPVPTKPLRRVSSLARIMSSSDDDVPLAGKRKVNGTNGGMLSPAPVLSLSLQLSRCCPSQAYIISPFLYLI